MKATRELLELCEREFQVLANAVKQCLRRRRVLAHALLGHPQVKRKGDETLLGAVMKVAFEAPALRNACLDDARPRGLQLIVCLGALEGERDELREVGEALLCIGWKVVGARREDEQRTPEPAACGDRCDDGR